MPLLSLLIHLMHPCGRKVFISLLKNLTDITFESSNTFCLNFKPVVSNWVLDPCFKLYIYVLLQNRTCVILILDISKSIDIFEGD